MTSERAVEPLTAAEALAKFGEPRYSITDLQRAYAEAVGELRAELLNLNRVYSGGKVTMDAYAFDALVLTEPLAATPAPREDGWDELQEALRDANAIIAMTREHLTKDHPDCAFTALGVMNDASRALLAAARGEPEIDVERLARVLRAWENNRHPLPSPDADDGPHTWDAWIAEARKLLDAAE